MDRIIDINTLEDLEEIRVILCAAGMTDLEYRIRTMIHYAGYNELIGNGKNEGLEPEAELFNREGDAFVFQTLLENADDGYSSVIMDIAEKNEERMTVLRDRCTERAIEDEAALWREREKDIL